MDKSVVFPAGALALLAAVAGCGSPDRPATSESVLIEQTSLGTAPATPTEPGIPIPRRVCEPRANRECRITYVDEDGQLQCPADVEICSLDGTRWLPCGQYVYDENHDPQPRP